jgi:pyruvate/2-oxoglutarate dehydrogenase complex dihydrolipoamide dehydrogenase (E3) component
MARRAAEYGVGIGGPVGIDMAAVKARKDRIVQASLDSLDRWLRGTPNLSLIWGSARFTGPREVAVGGEALRARRVFINTGGRPVVPDWPGLADVAYLTNTSMMALDALPEHLVVAGGTYIGLEFAQMYRRFGSRVTVLEHADRLIAREDPDVSDAVRDILGVEGITVHLGARDFTVAGRDGGVQVDVALDGKPSIVAGSHLLLAVGRRPTSRTSTSRRGWCSTPGASSPSTTSSGPARTASGPWGTSTGGAHSPTPRTTITRSSRPTSSTATPAAFPTGSRPTPCSPIRRWAGSA